MRDLKESACYRIYWEGVPNAEDRMNVSLGPGTRPRFDLNRESSICAYSSDALYIDTVGSKI
jgi:hypothetical protein